MLSLAQLKPGVRIIFQAAPFEILSSRHTKLARSQGQASVRMKNLLSGTIITHTFSGNQTLPEADIHFINAQFLYRNGEKFIFMEPQGFQQFELDKQQISDSAPWLKEGQKITLLIWEEQPIGIQLPAKVTLSVQEAAPGLRGDRQTSGTKKITLETGASLDAPLFIKPGDRIIINTQTGKYVKRAE